MSSIDGCVSKKTSCMRKITESDNSFMQLQLLFIVGMPRSGTKLIRELVGQSKEIYMPPVESKWITTLVNRFGSGDYLLTSGDIQSINSSIFRSAFSANLKNLGKDVFEIPKTLAGRTLRDAIKHFLFSMSNGTKTDLKYVGDKTPSNIFKLDLLKKLDPDLKIIHIVRDPRDQCRSVNKTWGKSPVRNASKWSNAIRLAEAWSSKNKGKYLALKYEDLLSDTKTELNKVQNFLKLKSNIDFKIEQSIESFGDARHQKGIVINNCGKWKDYFDSKTVKLIESLTINEARKVGYEINEDVNAKELSKLQNLFYRLIDSVRMCSFYTRERGPINGLRYYLKTLLD